MAETADRIYIRDLRLACIIGDLPEERDEKQEVIVNLTLHVDARAAGASDRLDDAVDYAAVEADVAAMVRPSSYFLLERLAERIAEVCLAAAGVAAVRVRVDKPGASHLAQSIGVEIFRALDGKSP